MHGEEGAFSLVVSESMLRSYAPGYIQSWGFGEAIKQ